MLSVKVKAGIVFAAALLTGAVASAQIRTDKVMMMGRNALYYEDYVLAIQRFNAVISAKPYLHEPYFYRSLAKFYLEDFAGAESDVDVAIDKSPFNAQYYQLRAMCRINTQRYAEAISDYRVALRQNTTDKSSWHNMVYCMIETKQLDSANVALDSMLTLWPAEAQHYTMKAEVAIMQKDTLLAESNIDRAIAIDQYDGGAWSMKAMLLLSRDSCSQAEDALDRAIMQKPRQAPLYVQRAMARYHQNKLRGAMSDYDRALEIDKNNYVAHYNRGLLRAQVGDDNLAIEDFNFILSVDPKNMIVLYNRAILLDQTGDYHGAIRDISAVIKEYPQFWAGYRHRASILRKIGDRYGAERDEFRVLKAEMQVRTGTYKVKKTTRKKDDLDIDAYNKLITDEEEDNKVMYASEWRGKVQNRKTDLRPMPVYLLSFYKGESDTRRYVAYSQLVDKLNKRHILEQTLYLTTEEAALDSVLLALHQQRIGLPSEADVPIQHALDCYLVRDFDGAISLIDDRLIGDGDMAPLLYFLRAQARWAKALTLEGENSNGQSRLLLELAQQDLGYACKRAPKFVFAYYNRGNVLLKMGRNSEAIDAFSKAIELNPQLPEPYYNRAVAYILSGQTEKALSDFSHAGEKGLYQAYSLIKKYSKSKETQKAD